MKERILALGIALAANGAALAAVHVAMLDGARERLAQREIERVIVVGEPAAEALAVKNCPGRGAL
jgi:hypothetical protein